MTPPADRLLSDLHAAMGGELARFLPGLAAPADPRPAVGAEALLDAAMLANIVARFEARFGATDRRAILSMWSLIYFTAVLPPLLAANLMLGRQPDIALDRVRFIIAPNGRIEALRIGAAVRSVADLDAAARFDGVVRAHLSPFIDLVADRTGVARRLLWSNAGNVFEAFVRHLRTLAALPASPDHAGDLLGMRVLPDGHRNPLHAPVRYDEGRRIRRVCCLRYLIPDHAVCGVCPLPADNPARLRQTRH